MIDNLMHLNKMSERVNMFDEVMRRQKTRHQKITKQERKKENDE